MPKDLEFIQRGKVLIVRRQFQEAVRVCRLGLLANPTLVEGRLVLGMALMALGRYDDVLAEMRVALEVDASNVLATLLKGEALFYKGDHDQAHEVLERAKKLDPENDKPEKLLGEIRLARESGPWSDSSREVTDTKVYPAVADGPVTQTGPSDLPEAIPPLSRKSNMSSIELNPRDLEYDEQTEVDPSPAGATREVPVPDLAARIKPTAAHASADGESVEEEHTTMPWVSSDEDPEASAAGELPLSAEATPIRPAPVIPARARPTPKPTLLGIGTAAVQAGAIALSKRVPMSGDGFEDTGQGDDYADAPSAPGLPHLPIATSTGSGSVSMSTTSTTHSMALKLTGTEVMPRDDNSEPTRPESPQSLAHGGPPSSPPFSPRPLEMPPRRALPLSVSEEPPMFEDESTSPRPSGSSLSTPEIPSLVPSLTDNSEGFGIPLPRAELDEGPPRTVDIPETIGLSSHSPSVPVPSVRVLSVPVPSLPARKRRRWRPTFDVPLPRTPAQWRLFTLGATAVLVLSVGLGLGIRAWRGRVEAAHRRELAQKQMALGNLPGFMAAERAFDKVLAAYPDDPEALAGRALVHASTLYEFDEPEREVRGAVEAARKAQNPRSEAMVEAASVYLELAGGDAELAEKTAREAATRHEDDALLAYLVGRAQLLRGDGRAASDSFRTALKRDPHSIFALHGLGLAEAGMGEAKGALSAFDRALSENAGHIATIIARARLRVQHGHDLLDAETDLVAVIEKFRGQASRAQVAWAELALAELYAQKGDVGRARAALDEARSSGPDRNSTFWEEASRAALKLYDVGGAKKDAQRAIGYAGAAAGPHLALAAALLEEGNAEAALSELAGTAARETPDVLVLRARARLALGRIEAARQDLDQAAAKAPDLPEVTLTRARVDLADHNAQRAVQTLKHLSDQLPGRADVMEVLGIALASRGDAGAKPALEKAVALNSHAYVARIELAKLLKQEGKPSDAAQRLSEAMALHVDPTSERELADLLFEAGDLVGAQRAMEAVLGKQAEPDGPTLLLAAKIAGAAGEPSGAERLLSQAVGKGVNPALANKVRAQSLMTVGDYKEAVAPAQKAVLANSADAEARGLYITALAGAGQIARARTILSSSPKRLANQFDLTYAYAQIQLRASRPDVRLLERVVRAAKVAKEPPRVIAEVHELLGEAYYDAGEIGHAGAAFSQALLFNKRDAQANYFEGLMSLESGQTDEARKAFQRATECRPRVPSAYFEFARLLDNAGEKAAARKAYDEYLALDPDGDYAEDARRALAQLGPR